MSNERETIYQYDYIVRIFDYLMIKRGFSMVVKKDIKTVKNFMNGQWLELASQKNE